ncbi:MAG: hypothetical protein ABIN79_11675 [Marmoricola sp.]
MEPPPDLVAGDKKAASEVATPEAVAFFDPWSPAPDYTFTMADAGTFFISTSAVPLQCRVAGGRVTGCVGKLPSN